MITGLIEPTQLDRVLAGFIGELRSVLGDYSELTLVGSWATGEPHIPSAVDGVIYSQSDVDLVLTGRLTASAQAGIRSRLLRAASDAGLYLTGVSMRPAAELAHAPHALEWGYANGLASLPHASPADFLAFWTLISALEGCIRVAENRRGPARAVLSYAAAKYCLTLFKNVAIIQGDTLRSYAATTAWARMHCPGVSATWAYGVKVGTLDEVTPNQAAGLTGMDSILREMGEIVDGRTGCIVAIGSDFASALAGTGELRAECYLEQAWTLAPKLDTRGIVEYERRKWEATRHHPRH